jgi:hypothetical protein
VIVTLLALSVACGSEPTAPPGGRSDAGPGSDAAPSQDAAPGQDATGADAVPADSGLGEPITGAPRTWTWVDFPESACDDGTTTGIGVNFSDTSQNLLIFLNGGGSCWDYQTCYELNTAAHGPFGSIQFAQLAPLLVGGIYDRNAADNVFRDWNYVFVPYCTGDLHTGSNVVSYTGSLGQMRTHHHAGYTNFLAFLRRLAATFPSPPKVAHSGASAGGYGTLYTYPDVRAAWPNSRGYLIDDSGPALGASTVIPVIRDAWIAAWEFDDVVVPICDQACLDDPSLVYTALSARYPDDRFALTSSLQDSVIRSYFGLTAQDFQAALLAVAQARIAPAANFKYFFVAGETHTMLASPAAFVSGADNLSTWMRYQVLDDPGWSSTQP